MENKPFRYVYTAPTEAERKEIASIRKQYDETEQAGSKLDYLRALDKRVRNVPKAWAITLGTVGCLTFGLGLAMVLEWSLTLAGVGVALVGGLVMGGAYPLHSLLLKGRKRRYGEEILRLSEELLTE